MEYSKLLKQKQQLSRLLYIMIAPGKLQMLVAVDAVNYGKKQLEPAAFKVKPRAWRLSSLLIPGRIHIIALATA